jgi:hypothetical protein
MRCKKNQLLLHSNYLIEEAMFEISLEVVYGSSASKDASLKQKREVCGTNFET